MVLTQNDIKTYLSHTPPLIDCMIDPDIQIQPNGVDFTLRKIAHLKGQGVIDFSNKYRQLSDEQEIAFPSDGRLTVLPGLYIVTFNEIVHLPNHIAALGKPRSSLLRMGVSLHTAVWDAGYHGRGQALLHVINPDGVQIMKSARILQLVFFELSSCTEGYKGVYQGEHI